MTTTSPSSSSRSSPTLGLLTTEPELVAQLQLLQDRRQSILLQLQQAAAQFGSNNRQRIKNGTGSNGSSSHSATEPISGPPATSLTNSPMSASRSTMNGSHSAASNGSVSHNRRPSTTTTESNDGLLQSMPRALAEQRPLTTEERVVVHAEDEATLPRMIRVAGALRIRVSHCQTDKMCFFVCCCSSSSSSSSSSCRRRRRRRCRYCYDNCCGCSCCDFFRLRFR